MSQARSLVLIAVACLAAVAVALVSQHGFGIQPCPWCVLQRAIFVAIGMVALLGAAIQVGAARLSSSGLLRPPTVCFRSSAIC